MSTQESQQTQEPQQQQPKCRWVASGNLMKTIANLSVIVEKGEFHADQNGLMFRQMDPFHVAMIDFSIPHTIFEEYECVEPVRFHLYTKELQAVFKNVKKNDVIEMSVDEKLSITIRNALNSTYQINLLDEYHNDTPLPKIPFEAKFTITMSAFKQIVKEIDRISEYITITATKNTLSFQGKGGSGTASFTLDPNNKELIELAVSNESSTIYRAFYLADLAKALASASKVTIEFATMTPLRVRFILTEKEKELYIDYYLGHVIMT